MAARPDSDEDEESFVRIGTALAPYEQDAPLKKAFTVQDHKVTDAQGRQRFHGAFTGGFSAGYFNTVGTKEGWTPATFTSSRQNRAEKSGQRPEDFMDDEDLGEYGIAPREVKTTQNFTSSSSQQQQRPGSKRPLVTDGGIIPGAAPLADVVVPARLPIGIQLLRKLGWKEGQGIGPRVKKKSRRRKPQTSQDGQKVYGCTLPPAQDMHSSSDEEELIPENLTFAPKDVAPISFTPKDDLHGLGYRGISVSRDTDLASRPTAQRFSRTSAKNEAKARGFKGQAFGVGALEDDDDDIYSVASMSNYDTVLGGPDTNNTHGWTAPKHAGAGRSTSRFDTEPVIEGFKLLSTRLNPKKVYEPPDIPRGFKAYHTFTQDDEKSVKNAAAIPAKFSFGWKNMDASDRREALGEKPEFKSVFDLIDSDAKKKLEQVQSSTASKDSHHDDKNATADVSGSATKPNVITSITSATSSIDQPAGSPASGTDTPKDRQPLFKGSTSSFNTFKPFAKDPAKQARYERYQELKKHGKTDDLSDVWRGEVTEWERARETEEFIRASQLYRPMSSLMASRFTRAEHQDEDMVTTRIDNKAELSDQAKAAKMNMYGRMTRETVEWHPDKVLCKRFNVPNPYPDSNIVGVPTVKRDKYSVFSFLGLPGEKPPEEPEKKAEEIPENKPVKKTVGQRSKPLAILATVDLRVTKAPPDGKPQQKAEADDGQEGSISALHDSTQPEPSEKPERPPVDIFKAIFEDSEDEENSSESEEEKMDANNTQESNSVTTKAVNLWKTPLTNPTSSDKLTDKDGSGHPFPESMDLSESLLDPLQKRLQDERTLSDEDSNGCHTPPTDDGSNDEGSYGPSLPPGLSLSVRLDSADRKSSEPERHKKAKKHKDKHKHKKKKAKHKTHKSHKHKDKKKKKKKKSKDVVISVSSSSSESSGSDSNNGNSPPNDAVLLDKLRTVSGRLCAADYM